jgi:uncharacterized protein
MSSVIDQIVERKASIDAGEFMALSSTEDWYESAMLTAARKLQDLFLSNTSRRVNVIKLQAIVSEFQENPLAHTACKKGCSNCCHQPVMLSQTEADAIGHKIHRTPARLKVGHVMKGHHEYGRETPCTFLADGACSIYEDRPFVCRNYVNSDKDSLLCSFENWDLAKANDPRCVHTLHDLGWRVRDYRAAIKRHKQHSVHCQRPFKSFK